MTIEFNLEKVGSLRSVGDFHGVQAYSGVFQAPSYYSSGPPQQGGGDGAQVGTWRGCLVRYLLGGDVFPPGAMRWMGEPPPCTGLRCIAAY
jgi:hypothetical protein